MPASWQNATAARQDDRDIAAVRALKRPRIDPSRAGNKENAVKSGYSRQNVNSRAEVAMMEDLLAGLEASAFDGFEVSPVKPRQAPRLVTLSPTRKPLTPNHHVVRDDSPRTPAHSSLKLLAGHKSPSKQSPSKRTKPSPDVGRAITVKVELKPELTKSPAERVPKIIFPAIEHRQEEPMLLEDTAVKLEEDDFDFGFDLAELADIDEKTLLIPPPSVSGDTTMAR